MAQLPSSVPHLQDELRLHATGHFGTGVRIRGESDSTLRRLVELLVLIVLPTLARPQTSFLAQDLPRDDYTINVNVDVFVLHATLWSKVDS